MAEQLVESLSAKFDPEKYHDEYREQVIEMIEAKAAGQEIVSQPAVDRSAHGRRPHGRPRSEPGRVQGREEEKAKETA